MRFSKLETKTNSIATHFQQKIKLNSKINTANLLLDEQNQKLIDLDIMTSSSPCKTAESYLKKCSFENCFGKNS